jgi:peptidoglycan hydrolase-like protein with peptidoglycan-binding domain
MLRVGSTGPAVAQLKQRLANIGYLVDRDTDVFTDATAHAVMAFQKVNGLERDGVAGPATATALLNPKKPWLSSGEANRIVVDLSEQVLYIVKNDKLAGISNASTGNPQSPDGLGIATPLGRYHVQRKVGGPDKAPLGILYWPSYFNNGIAVHGAPVVPAYRASHGCVRVPMHLDEYIYNRMPVGTQVIIRG